MRWGWLTTPKDRLVTALSVVLDLCCQILLLIFVYVMVFQRLQAAFEIMASEPDPVLEFVLNILCADWFCVLDLWPYVIFLARWGRVFLVLGILFLTIVLCWNLLKVIIRLARFVLVTAWKAICWFARKLDLVAPDIRSYLPEMSMPGSSFINIRTHPGQFCFLRGTRVVGHGCRIGGRLVAPLHVTTIDGLIMRDALGKSYPSPSFDYLCTDVGYTDMPAGFSVPDTKVGPLTEGLASITGVEPHSGSVGVIKPFGFDVSHYTGSTRAGMSGALYVLGGRAIAMHLGGTPTANIGVPLEYVRMQLDVLEYSPESSDYLLLKKAMGAGKKKLMFRNIGDPDMVEVLYNGKYYRVDRSVVEAEDQARYEEEEFERAFGTRHDVSYQRENAEVDEPVISQPAVDPLPEYSGNEERPAGRNASRASVITPPTVKNAAGTSSISRKSPVTTNGQEAPKKKSLTPSRFTPESGVSRTQKRELQTKESAYQSLAKLRRAIASGTINPSLILTTLEALKSFEQQ